MRAAMTTAKAKAGYMTIRISFPAASLRDPAVSADKVIALEDALFCDGSGCGAAVFSDDGELELLRPHWHMIVTGRSPEAGPRRYPIWG
jgi:hypothetical protein